MSDKFPYGAAETGTKTASGVDLSGTAVDLGANYPTRPFAAAAADTNVDFDSTDTCQVAIVKDADNWLIYKRAVWTDAATDTIGTGTATLLAQEGTIANSDSVSVYAQDPEDRKLPDAEGAAQGSLTQVNASGEWVI